MTLKEILIAGKLTISEGGGGGAQTASGTFTGNDTTSIVIPCEFAPDAVYITRINAVALSKRVFAGFIGGTFGEHSGYVRFQNNANTTTDDTYTGGLNQPSFSYANGNIKVGTGLSDRPASSQCEYFWFAVKWTE